MVLLPISLLITALTVLCLLKIIKTINSSSLIVTNYRRQRNSSNANTTLSDQRTVKSTKIPTVNTAEISSSSSSSSEKPEKRYSRQDSYFGTYFGIVNGKSILELENPENKVWTQLISSNIIFIEKYERREIQENGFIYTMLFRRFIYTCWIFGLCLES